MKIHNKIIALIGVLIITLGLYVFVYYISLVDMTIKAGGGTGNRPMFIWNGPGILSKMILPQLVYDENIKKVKPHVHWKGYGIIWVPAAYIYIWISGQYTYGWSDRPGIIHFGLTNR